VHFSGSTFLAPYLYKFSEMVQILVPFGPNLHYIACLFSIIILKVDAEAAPFMVLFGTKLVSNICNARLALELCN
jgi:hypothetical protein